MDSQQLQGSIRSQLQNRQLIQEWLPIWTDWGIEDTETWVHSLGVTFWTLLGHKLGFVAISEAPAIRNKALYSEDQIRSDSVWYEPETHNPTVIIEFERYSGAGDQTKLAGKVKNLLIAQQRADQTPKVLILAYWTKGVKTLPPHHNLLNLFATGFETLRQIRIPGSSTGKLMFFQFVLHEHRDHKLRLEQVLERGVHE
ncbi:MAG: hypothetical protein K1Y36_21695 [Blastocatellia bacterium]|nr:hypothetical protein [Blastocatellia bacterium]HNG96074.1 hypothetical protein [Acidobacteriota bacterium]